MSENRVAGVFATRAKAEAACEDLLRAGLTEHDVEVSAPAPGRYRLEDCEAEEMGHGAAIGVAIGVPLGALISIGILIASVPGILDAGLAGLGLGAVIGGFWGIFFGGLAGVVPKVLAQDKRGGRCEVLEDGREMMVVVQTGAETDVVRKVMRRRGGRIVTQIPAVRPAAAFRAMSQVA